MTAPTWVPLAVAVLAAVAAVVGAVLARRSARDAQRTADGIDRRRHMIEALDAETESFQSALRAFFEAIGSYSEGPGGRGEWGIHAGASLHMVRVHPLCTTEAAEAGRMYAKYIVGVESDAEENGSGFFSEVRSIFAAQAEKRRQLVEGLPREATLTRRRARPRVLPMRGRRR